jgi:DNA-binding transcriptional LysR family regulator
MELRHLRYFVAVAEELNFRRAAVRLGIAQPALSQQIRQLEDELGLRLLDRNRRRVELTEAGTAFLDKARGSISLAGDAVRAAQQADRGETGRLGIGFVTSALYGVFPDIVRKFRQRYPQVHLELHEMPVSQHGDMLRKRRIDVSILRPPIDEHGLVVRTILWEPWVVAMPESNPAARHRVVPLKSLAKEGFILFPRTLAPPLYDGILAACQKAGFSPQIVIEAQMHTMVSLAAAGMGVALVPESMQNLRRKGLAYRPLQEPAPKVALALAWRDEPVAPVLKAFLDAVGEVAG